MRSNFFECKRRFDKVVGSWSHHERLAQPLASNQIMAKEMLGRADCYVGWCAIIDYQLDLFSELVCAAAMA